MRIHIASIIMLLVGTAAGCGEVEDSSCPGEQSDNVACTLDVCNAEGGGWAHIPNNNLCEAGQACSATAGCVAGGSLGGSATLLGKTDHSGIVVTVNGVEGATATTDAAGAWTILIPPGRYTVTYSKEDYITETSTEIIVLADAAEVAPATELAHGEMLAADRTITGSYGSSQNPDKSFLIEAIATPFGTAYYATPMDGSKGPVHIVTSPNAIQYTNTHAVWTEGNIVYSRPLSGANEPVNLSSTITGGTITIFAVANTYTVIRRNRTLPTFTESSLYLAKTDGSMPAGAAIWTQPDAQHTLAGYVGNDAVGLIGVNNTSNASGPPADTNATKPLLRVDLASGTVTAVDIGFATTSIGFQSVSPDNTRVLGYVRQYTGSQNWYRGFVGNISSGAFTLAPNPGLGSGTTFHDYPSQIDGWLADNSVVFRSEYYYTGTAYAAGELRVWPVTGAPVTLIGTNQSVPYQNFYHNVYLLNGAVAWREYSTNALRVASATSSIYTLDSTGFVSSVWSKVGTGTGGSYLAWTQVPSGNLPNKVYGANIPAVLSSQPPTVQLGPNIPANCSFEGTLAGTTYFQLCSESGTLTAYAAASNTPAGSTTGVHGSLSTVTTSDRIFFRKTDGFLYSASTTGTFADVKAVSTKADGNSPIAAVGGWVVVRDGAAQLTRISKADGSVIDEPLFDCDMAGAGQLWLNTASTHLFATSARCGNISFGMVHAPTSNLP
jgi:hypothetical protein